MAISILELREEIFLYWTFENFSWTQRSYTGTLLLSCKIHTQSIHYARCIHVWRNVNLLISCLSVDSVCSMLINATNDFPYICEYYILHHVILVCILSCTYVLYDVVVLLYH